jgi:hypothetical protein
MADDRFAEPPPNRLSPRPEDHRSIQLVLWPFYPSIGYIYDWGIFAQRLEKVYSSNQTAALLQNGLPGRLKTQRLVKKYR